MADFLTRLVERTLGLVPVAQPLIAPMFAPGPAMAGYPPPLLKGGQGGFGSAPDEELTRDVSMQESARRVDGFLPLGVSPEGSATAPVSENLSNFSSPSPSLAPLVPQDVSLATPRQPLRGTPDTLTAPRQHAESVSLGRDEAVPSRMTGQDNPVPSTPESRFVLDEDSPPSPGAQGSVSSFIKGKIPPSPLYKRGVGGDFPQSDSEPSRPVQQDAFAQPTDHKPKALVNEVNTSTLRPSVPAVIRPQVTASEDSPPGKHPATDAQVQVAPSAVRTLADPVRNASLQPEHSPGAQGSVSSFMKGFPQADSEPSIPVQRDASAQPADHKPKALVNEVNTSTLRPSVPAVIRPQVTPHFERMEPIPANQRIAGPESSSITPTIRVTIGHIEVRAVFSPPTPSPQRVSPPAPKLSLDEYLQSRHGGKR